MDLSEFRKKASHRMAVFLWREQSERGLVRCATLAIAGSLGFHADAGLHRVFYLKVEFELNAN